MSCYFFYGEEGFLVEEATASLRKERSDLEWEFFPQDGRWTELTDKLSGVSLFGTSSGIIVSSPWFFKTTQDNDPNLLQHCLSALVNSPHVLVIQLAGKAPDKRKKIYKTLSKEAVTREFAPFKDWEQDKVRSWINDRIQHTGKSISREALSALEDLGGTNLRHLSTEIEKLAVYAIDKPEISLGDVQAVCSSVSSGVYKFSEALKRRQLKEALLSLSQLLKDGDDPIRLLGLVTSSFRLYLQLSLALKGRASFETIGSKLRKNPYYLKMLWKDLQGNYSVRELEEAMVDFSELDYRLKTGQVKPEVGIQEVLVKVLG